MKISTDDSAGDVSTLIYDAAVFYAKDQGVYSKPVSVEIMPIDDLMKDSGVFAFVKPVYSKKHEIQQFFITYDSTFPEVIQLKCLAHEFVHVRQYLNGDVKQTSNEDIYLWKGKSLRKTKRAPWEIEAIGLEGILLCEFLVSVGKINMINAKQSLKFSL